MAPSLAARTVARTTATARTGFSSKLPPPPPPSPPLPPRPPHTSKLPFHARGKCINWRTGGPLLRTEGRRVGQRNTSWKMEYSSCSAASAIDDGKRGGGEEGGEGQGGQPRICTIARLLCGAAVASAEWQITKITIRAKRLHLNSAA